MTQLQASANGNGSLYNGIAAGGAHVLLLPFPAQGHLNPVMHLGRAIAELAKNKNLKLRVTLLTVNHFEERIRRSSIGGGSGGVEIIGVDDGLPPDASRETMPEEFNEFVNGPLEDRIMSTIQKLADAGTPVTCIVSDFFLKWASSLADKAKLPEYVFWPQNATVCNIYMHTDDIVKSGYDPVEGNVPAAAFPRPEMEPVSCVPGVAPMHPADLPFELFSMKSAMVWLKSVIDCRAAAIRSGAVRGLIISSLPELEKEAYKAIMAEYGPHLKVRMAGPLVPVAGSTAAASLWEEQADDCKRWLDAQPSSSVIYVSFGSFTRCTVEQMHEIAWGLEASGYRFLWVIRPGSVVENLTDTPPKEVYNAEIPSGFWDGVGDRGKVVRWAPQAQVLRHVAVGGFFSHCGWNSTLESLAAGVPVLGRPWICDQATNCWMLSEYWRVGVALPLHCLRREDVAEGVRRLMSDEDMARRAADISAVVAKGYYDNDLAVLAEEIVQRSSF